MKVSGDPRMLGRRVSMWSLSSGRRFSTFASFHSLVSLVSKSETMRSLSCRDIGPKGFMFSSGLIHESFQTEVDSPSPMAFPRWLSSRFLPSRIPLQPCETLLAACTFRKETLLQYLLRRIFASRESGKVLEIVYRKRFLTFFGNLYKYKTKIYK